MAGGLRVRWIGKYQIELFPVTLEKSKHIKPNDCTTQFGFFAVGLDRNHRITMVINKSGIGCPATQRFETECATTGKKIEHSGANDPVAQ